MSKTAKRWRGWKPVTLSAAVLLTVGLVVASPASAVLTGSTFEGNDGNMAVNTSGNTDWANVAGRNTGIDDPSGSTDNAFGNGTKEDNSAVSIVAGSIPPNKNDLTRFYEASQIASNGHVYLELAWERLVNIGNANLDFEFNQNPTTTASGPWTGSTTGPLTINRTAGDLLVTYDFGGSGTPTLGLLTWVTTGSVSQCYSANALPCWGNRIALSGTNSEGAVNTTTFTDTFANTSETAGLFGEAAIDLTGAGVFKPGICAAFGNAYVKSRSSSSFTAEMKDFIAPISVNVTNCGSIKIQKVTENGDDTFGYTDTNLSPSSFTLSNGGSKTFTPVQPGSYSVTENLTSAQTTAGWSLKSLSCTSSGTGTSTTTTNGTASITIGGGGTVTCTYTNHLQFSPTIATNLSASTANINDSVTDSATLSGATANAGGSVTYHVYAGSTCTGTDLLNSTVTVTNGSVPNSGSFKPSAAGTYQFQAVYSGDANNNGATSACLSEALLVKTNPGITTQLSQTTANTGDSITDSATLSAVTSDAGGSVTYHVYAGSACTGPDLLNSTVLVVNGTAPKSAAFTPTTAGHYQFQAVYSGDTKNNGATSACLTEDLLVKASPSISTLLSQTVANIGNNITDSASLNGATASAGGTVTYHVYAGVTCTGDDLLNSTVMVTNGVVPNSAAFTPTSAGTYQFQAVYSGDTNNNGATSACLSEQLLVKTNPVIKTTLSSSSITVGDTIHDSAALTSATADAGGSVTYTVYTDSMCTAGAMSAGTVTVTNGAVPDSSSVQFTNAGDYYWQAVYSGDTKNNAATSTCTEEHLVVNKQQPGGATAQSLIPNDTFTLSGATSGAGGSVTMSLYAPSDSSCSGTPALTQTVPVSSNGSYSTTNTTFVASTVGTWRWQSSYSGDANNLGVTSACGAEQFTIQQ